MRKTYKIVLADGRPSVTRIYTGPGRHHFGQDSILMEVIEVGETVKVLEPFGVLATYECVSETEVKRVYTP